jgi:hypothetical protein
MLNDNRGHTELGDMCDLTLQKGETLLSIQRI